MSSRAKLYLTELNETPKIDRPGGEQEDEDVEHGDSTKDYAGVGEIEARQNNKEPDQVEKGEGPGVQSPGPMPSPERVHALDDLAVDVELRHGSAAEGLL